MSVEENGKIQVSVMNGTSYVTIIEMILKYLRNHE